LGFHVARASGMTMDVFTQTGKYSEEDCMNVIKERNLERDRELYINKWHFFESNNFEDILYEVPHDSLVILGAYGHGVIKDILFGSKLEMIQSTISNNLLIAGPNYATTL
jgi:hypothetical protein